MHRGDWAARKWLAAAIGLCLSVFCVAAALAQEQKPIADRILSWDATAAGAESLLESQRPVHPNALERLRASLIEQRAEAQEAQKQLEAQLTPLRSQLTALGDPPDPDATEAPDVAERRDRLVKQIAEGEGRLKEVGLALTRASTLQQQLAQRQRKQFTETLLTRGPGPLDQSAWSMLWGDAPSMLNDGYWLVTAMVQRYDAQGSHALITFAFAISALLALFGRPRARRAARRLGQAAAATSSFALRVVYAVLEFVLRASPLPLAVLFLALVISEVGEPSPFESLLLLRLVETVAIVAVVAALSGMAFRAEPPERRVISLEPPCDRLAPFALTAFAAAVALDRLALDLLESAGAATGTLTIVNAAFSALAAAALLLFANRFRPLKQREPEEQAQGQLALDALQDPDDAADDIDWRTSAVSGLRALLFVAAVVLLSAALLGYYALSRFAMNGVALSALLLGVGALAYAAITRSLTPAPPASAQDAERDEAAALPGPKAQGAGLIKLLVAFALALAAAPLLGLIWGASRADVLSISASLVEGVRVGDSVFSLTDVFLAILVLLAGFWATRMLQRVLSVSVLPNTSLAMGARTAISAGVGYIGFILTSLIAVAAAGFDLSNIAIIAGALSVGIGFGLQNVVNNFVSGLILLIERPIQPGDWIEVGGHSGNVKRINVRSTEIVTFDRSSVIVPNSELISASVVNWTHKSLVGRVIVRVGVSYDSDPDQLVAILTEIADNDPLILKTPPPKVFFVDFGASSLDFDLHCYLRDVTSRLSVGSQLRFEILKRLREAGMEIPFPQRVVHVVGSGAAALATTPDLDADGRRDPLDAPESSD